jgi:hypothetical protein
MVPALHHLYAPLCVVALAINHDVVVIDTLVSRAIVVVTSTLISAIHALIATPNHLELPTHVCCLCSGCSFFS